MDAQSYARVQQIFLLAVELPENERAAFVARESAGDNAILEQVKRMLETDALDGQILDRNLADVAGQVLPRTAQAPERFGPAQGVGAHQERDLDAGLLYYNRLGLGLVCEYRLCIHRRQKGRRQLLGRWSDHAGMDAVQPAAVPPVRNPAGDRGQRRTLIAPSPAE